MGIHRGLTDLGTPSHMNFSLGEPPTLRFGARSGQVLGGEGSLVGAKDYVELESTKIREQSRESTWCGVCVCALLLIISF